MIVSDVYLLGVEILVLEDGERSKEGVSIVVLEIR